ncbi:MAG: hypothetical protein ABSD90_15845 [Methylocystis sp.]|jgi:hypothetical protein
MSPFKSKAVHPRGATTTTALDTPRAELREAISEREQARKALDDAHAAVSRAGEAWSAAIEKREALRRQEPAPAPDVVESILAGDTLALERPDEKAREITEAEREIKRWSSMRDAAEEAVEARTRALAEAEKQVDRAARAVLAAGIDVSAMLADAQTAADWIVNRRAVFLHLMSVLKDGPEYDQLSRFMAKTWLIGEFDETWKRNPSIAPYASALTALQRDAEARIDIAS